MTVGDVFFHAAKDKVVNNLIRETCLLCDGRAVNRTLYPELFNVIGTTWGEGDGSTTFNLPNSYFRVIEGAYNSVGTEVEAGLPNITGKFYPRPSDQGATIVGGLASESTGCFTKPTPQSGTAVNWFPIKLDSTKKLKYDTIEINASRSSSIYGKSDTVQPASIRMECLIVAKLKQNIQHKVTYCFKRIN